MTARELIEKLQSFGEEKLDLEVCIYDEYRYVNVDSVEIVKENTWKGKEDVFIGIC